MRISFHGADRGVTGSCHLVESAGKRVLIDCGRYQGGRELDEENAEPFGFDGDRDELLCWHHRVGAPRTFLVYGEEGFMRQFATLLGGTRVEMPVPGKVYDL